MYIRREVGQCMLLIGNVELVDESFDHEFGVKKQTGLEVKDFSIMLFDDNIEQDITKSFNEKQIEYYKDKLLEQAKLELAGQGMGRPKKQRLVTINEALVFIKEYWLKRGVSEESIKELIPAKGTIYNKISLDQLQNHGSRRSVLLDENEILEKLCS